MTAVRKATGEATGSIRKRDQASTNLLARLRAHAVELNGMSDDLEARASGAAMALALIDGEVDRAKELEADVAGMVGILKRYIPYLRSKGVDGAQVALIEGDAAALAQAWEAASATVDQLRKLAPTFTALVQTTR
jgi:hypothetical protein